MNDSENKNEGLNTISLGNVDNGNNLNVPIQDIPPVEPVPMPEENIETLDDLTPNTPSVDSTPQVVPPIESVEPVAPIRYDVPQSIDQFNVMPTFNEIGTIPPITNDTIPKPETPKPKKKDGMNKLLFVIIVVLAMAVVGVGVFIFLHISNNKVKVVTKEVSVEINGEVSSNINDYATFNGVSSSSCSLDTTGVSDTSILNAEYTYKIVCGETTYTGTVKIVDTTAPKVELKDVNVSVNGSVEPEDFIEACEDETTCSYSFKDKDKVDGYLKEEASYHVDIVVKDEADNETVVTGTLNVSNTVASLYLVCNKTSGDVPIVTKFGLVDGQFNKTATRTYTFSFDTQEEYNAFKTENSGKTEITYNSVTGAPTFNDDTFTMVITQIVTYDTLNTEMNTTLPLDYGSLKTLYEQAGNTCSIGY